VNTANADPLGDFVPAGASYGGQISEQPLLEVQFETLWVSMLKMYSVWPFCPINAVLPATVACCGMLAGLLDGACVGAGVAVDGALVAGVDGVPPPLPPPPHAAMIDVPIKARIASRMCIRRKPPKRSCGG
jgi:hypothetical protein